MTNEFEEILNFYSNSIEKKLSCVVATIVELEGSSYRKPGVRMLLREDGFQLGAISGGCVEKDVWNYSKNVFNSNVPITISYDGRYRLGCEGILYILIEPIKINLSSIKEIKKFILKRKKFKIESFYDKSEKNSNTNQGSIVLFEKNKIKFNEKVTIDNEGNSSILKFSDILIPKIRLIIIGTEHDASHLCKSGKSLGWEVIVIGSPKSKKTKINFPDADIYKSIDSSRFDELNIDYLTSVVLISHNYAYDLKNFIELSKYDLFYLGILGNKKRKNTLIEDSIEYEIELNANFLDSIHSPAGINIGAITPQEIATSIVSEILSVSRKNHKKDNPKIK